MPVYTYRREDGTTFDIRQKFLDDSLELCPTTSQKVSRVIHAAGIIFKGSGFYVNDNNKATNPANPTKNGDSNGNSDSAKPDAKAETKSDTKSESKSEVKTPSAAAD
jgi:putative FmdB family regulatory protein